MTTEEVLQRWQPEPGSQLHAWVAQLAQLGAASNQLLASRSELVDARQAAAGRQMLAQFKADAAAVAQADAHYAEVDAAVQALDAQLVDLREQENALQIQIYQADEYLQGIMRYFDQGVTAAILHGELSEQIDLEFARHQRRILLLLTKQQEPPTAAT